jgi:hypothetical protein
MIIDMTALKAWAGQTGTTLIAEFRQYWIDGIACFACLRIFSIV